jgi:acyl dehydratase
MSLPLESFESGAIVAERTFGPITGEHLQRYAEASGDMNPLHLNREFARQAGFDDVIVHGMLGMALVGRLVTEDLPRLRLLAFRARFRHVIRAGEVIQCRARLRARDGETVVLALEALNSAGTQLIDGSATLKLCER